jgi:predicted DNA binding CopG/RHH family protein
MYTGAAEGERMVVPKFKTEAEEARASRNVTIRMVKADLDLARKQAEEKGLPYQTYIKSVLHEALVKRARRKAS